MKKMFWFGLAGVLGLGVASPGQAAPDGAMPMQMSAGGQMQASVASATGVVRQVNPEAGKVKISHEPIAALGWPAMTMYFRVKDKAMLAGIAPDDKVDFQLEKDASGLVISRIEKIAR